MFPRGPRMPMGQMNNVNRFMPFNQMPRAPMAPRGAGGLLYKLFSRQGGASAMNGIAGQTFKGGVGGFLSNLTNPGSAAGMLGNIQKVMNVANQVGPMVQQYGPMIRNIPSLITLYKEFNRDDDSDQVESTEKKEVPTMSKADDESVAIVKGTSKPKLYI
jgi:hypothetical protein